MGKVYDTIDATATDFIRRQHVFFVATAPLAADGHLNLSPKGLESFTVLGPSEVAYLDLTGSGVETIAHLRENARIVVMFCAFDGPPRILRVHGVGRVVWAEDPDFEALLEQADFEPWTIPQARRAVVDVEVTRVATSCGYGVPLMAFEGERPHYDLSKRKRLRTMGDEQMAEYQAANNASSLDGLPAVPAPARQP